MQLVVGQTMRWILKITITEKKKHQRIKRQTLPQNHDSEMSEKHDSEREKTNKEGKREDPTKDRWKSKSEVESEHDRNDERIKRLINMNVIIRMVRFKWKNYIINLY